MNRRKFISKTALSSIAAVIGIDIVFGNNMLEGYQPLALQDPDPFKLFGLDKEMTILNDKPWNIEAKAHLLNDKITPNKAVFIRNNVLIPQEIIVNYLIKNYPILKKGRREMLRNIIWYDLKN